MSVKAIIFDLDGTLIDTETLCDKVCKVVLKDVYGAEYTEEVAVAGRGKRPLEACQAAIDILSLKCTAQELFEHTEAKLTMLWPSVELLPGAARAVGHLAAHKVPIALATSSSQETVAKKFHGALGEVLKPCMGIAVYGTEVANGKPAPDIFLEAARRLEVPPESCLVVEDAPAGAEAALAAGMRVLVIPSVRNRSAYPPASDRVAFNSSLLDLRPESYGFPPFGDWRAGALRKLRPPQNRDFTGISTIFSYEKILPPPALGSTQLRPPQNRDFTGISTIFSYEMILPPPALDGVWRMKGAVVKGFGRGSKELGIPTANLPAEAIRESVGHAVCGIYIGYAGVGMSAAVYPMVMSIGWNPFYKNEEKTVEPWLLHEFEEDFYGEELRLVVCGYIRPEADFVSLEALIAEIHNDASIARAVLPTEPFKEFECDPFLKPSEME